MEVTAVLTTPLMYYASKTNNDMISMVHAEKIQEQPNSSSVWAIASKLVLVLSRYPNTGLSKIYGNSSVSIYARRRNYTLSSCLGWVTLITNFPSVIFNQHHRQSLVTSKLIRLEL